MADYHALLHATREKTARLRALRLTRDAANQGAPPAGKKGATQLAGSVHVPKKDREHNGTRGGECQQHSLALSHLLAHFGGKLMRPLVRCRRKQT